MTLALLLAASSLVALANASDGILMGQGKAPKDPVEVHVSFFLEKLLAVDEQNHRFEVSLNERPRGDKSGTATSPSSPAQWN